jgi:hypothetical protein
MLAKPLNKTARMDAISASSTPEGSRGAVGASESLIVYVSFREI